MTDHLTESADGPVPSRIVVSLHYVYWLAKHYDV